MLYHYALMPDVFRPELLAKSPSKQMALKQLLRGLCENGLVANLHADGWSRHVHADLLPNLPPQMKDHVQACLKRLADNHRLVTFPPCSAGNPCCHEDWLDAALNAHSQHELHGIVLTQALMQHYGWPHPAFVELSDVLDSPQWLDRVGSQTVTMSQPHYENALTPTLRYAGRLDLIDPYMNCHEARFFNVVMLCVRLLGKGRHKPDLKRIISIHAGDPQVKGTKRHLESVTDRLHAWRERLLPIVQNDANLTFRVALWSDDGKQEDFHDRFIITDQCCISIQKGLDMRSGTTPWSMQDKAIREDQQKKFSNANTCTTFQRLDKIDVTK